LPARWSSSITRRADGRPTAVIANTVKGRGVSFMEDRFYWHTRILTADEFATAMAELSEPLEGGATVTGGGAS